MHRQSDARPTFICHGRYKKPNGIESQTVTFLYNLWMGFKSKCLPVMLVASDAVKSDQKRQTSELMPAYD